MRQSIAPHSWLNGNDERGRRADIVLIERVVECAAQVRDLDPQARRGEARSPVDLGDRVDHNRAQVLVERADQGRGVAVLDEPFLRVGPQRLEVPVAPDTVVVDDREQRLGDQCLHQIEHVRLGEPVEHGRGAVEGEAAGEHRERGEGPLLVGIQQPVRPVDRLPERPLAVTGPAPPTPGQHVEASVEPVNEIGDRQDPDRAAVASSMASGSPSNRRQISSTRSTSPSRSANDVSAIRARSTNSVTAAASRPTRRGRARRRGARRRPRGLAARGQHARRGRQGEHISHEVSDGIEHVLAVVQHDEHPAAGQCDADRVHRRRAEAQRPRERRHHVVVVADLGQVDEDPEIVLRSDLLRSGHRDACLAEPPTPTSVTRRA